MNCSTKKNQYYTEDEATEALIRSHIRFNKPALSFYLCSECAQFHLTSHGEKHPVLHQTEVVERIKKEQQYQDWSNRLRRK
jgi:molybdenum cofactor biosynthesis enzyme MoaA